MKNNVVWEMIFRKKLVLAAASWSSCCCEKGWLYPSRFSLITSFHFLSALIFLLRVEKYQQERTSPPPGQLFFFLSHPSFLRLLYLRKFLVDPKEVVGISRCRWEKKIVPFGSGTDLVYLHFNVKQHHH